MGAVRSRTATTGAGRRIEAHNRDIKRHLTAIILPTRMRQTIRRAAQTAAIPAPRDRERTRPQAPGAAALEVRTRGLRDPVRPVLLTSVAAAHPVIRRVLVLKARVAPAREEIRRDSFLRFGSSFVRSTLRGGCDDTRPANQLSSSFGINPEFATIWGFDGRAEKTDPRGAGFS